MGLICDGITLPAAYHHVPKPGGSADGMQPGDPIQVIINVWNTLPPEIKQYFIFYVGTFGYGFAIEELQMLELNFTNVSSQFY